MRYRHLATLAAGAALALAACSKPAPPPPTPVGPTPEQIAQARQDSINRANAAAAERRRADSLARAQQMERMRQDSIARARAAEAAAAAEQAAMKTTLATMIHFDFDKSDLRDEDRALLDQKVPILLANPDVKVKIAGNADERGSDRYNMALGQRRAATAKRYLTDHGVADNRIETVSYGEERPLCQEHGEPCWGQNRRDEFEVTAAPSMLKKQ